MPPVTIHTPKQNKVHFLLESALVEGGSSTLIREVRFLPRRGDMVTFPSVNIEPSSSALVWFTVVRVEHHYSDKHDEQDLVYVYCAERRND